MGGTAKAWFRPLQRSPSTMLFATRNCSDGTIYLPFDLTEVLDNLRCELYVGDWREGYATSALARFYYWMRPVLPFGMRSFLKKLHLRGREELPFPRWPVDCSVDSLLEQVLLLAVRSNGGPERFRSSGFGPRVYPVVRS